MQGKRDNGASVADFVMLMGIYVVRLILECKSLTEYVNILGVQ